MNNYPQQWIVETTDGTAVSVGIKPSKYAAKIERDRLVAFERWNKDQLVIKRVK